MSGQKSHPPAHRHLAHCLKAHTGEIHTCKARLERDVDVRKVFSGSKPAWNIGCTEEEVRELLAVASRHCPAAVGAIRDSLERFIEPP